MTSTAGESGKRIASPPKRSTQPVEKRPRRSSSPPKSNPTPALVPALTPPPTLSDIAFLPLGASHNLIQALLHREPTTADVIRSHIRAEDAKRKQAPIPKFGHLPYAISSALSQYRNKYAPKSNISHDVDEGIRSGLEVIREGCLLSDRYETRLSAFVTILDMVDKVMGVDDSEVMYDIMCIMDLETALMDIWKEAEEKGEAQRLRDDEAGLSQRVKNSHEMAAGQGDGLIDFLDDLAGCLSGDGAVTDEEDEDENEEDGEVSDDDAGYFEIIG